MEWEDVESPFEGDYLERIPVPGGWLYRTVLHKDRESNESGPVCTALTFVPTPKKKNEATLDAYRRMLVFTMARLKLRDPKWDEVCRFVNAQMGDVGLDIDYADVERVLDK